MQLTEIYEHDKRSAAVCCQMQVDGFAFDQDRARALSAKLRGLEQSAIRRAEESAGRPIRLGKSGAFSNNDLKSAFFNDLDAPVYYVSELTGRPSLGGDALQAYALCADPRLRELALAVLEQRRARKLRTTYIDAVIVDDDGRVHPNWMNYGTVSGRWSSKEPNLQNLPSPVKDPTWQEGGIRGLYVAPPGTRLVYFDFSQVEMRVAAYASGDPVMIEACESSDLHATNARLIFGDAFDPVAYECLAAADEAGTLKPEDKEQFVALKGLRTLAKSAAFAVCYMAEPETVHGRLLAEGKQVTLRRVEAMLSRLHRQFARYYEWQEERFHECIRTGYVETPILGRRRWLGHAPRTPDAANFPIQGGAADIMNDTILRLQAAIKDHQLRARFVAQVHDSVVIETHEEDVGKMATLAREVAEQPHTITSSGEPHTASFPIDLEIIDRWK